MRTTLLPTLLPTLLALALASCGGNTGNNSSTSTGTASGTKDEEAKSAAYTDIIGTTPGEYEAALDKLTKKAGTDDPEFLEINSSFTAKQRVTGDANGYFTVQMANPTDKNKVAEYRLNWEDGAITGPTPVTLSEGIGSSEKFVDTYDGFKDHLFKKGDLDFSKVPALKKDAMDRASKDYGADCYVEYINVEKDERNGKVGPYFYVSVQSNRSITASKSYYYDAQGTYVE